MNFSYYTNQPNKPPQALSGLRDMPVQGYGQNFDDNYGKLAQQNALGYDIDVAKAQDAYLEKRNQQERESVLGGLQLLAEGQKQQQSLANDRLQQMTGLAGMLGGLYR